MKLSLIKMVFKLLSIKLLAKLANYPVSRVIFGRNFEKALRNMTGPSWAVSF